MRSRRSSSGMPRAWCKRAPASSTTVPLVRELAQETWIAIWTQRAHYRGEGRFVLWIITAARNRCRNYLRRHGSRRNPESPSPPDGTEIPSPNQIDELLLEERRRRVRGALARLPQRIREALLLRYGDELAYDEMADVLGIGASTLRSRVHHGLRLLRNLLESSR